MISQKNGSAFGEIQKTVATAITSPRKESRKINFVFIFSNLKLKLGKIYDG